MPGLIALAVYVVSKSVVDQAQRHLKPIGNGTATMFGFPKAKSPIPAIGFTGASGLELLV